MGIVIGIDLGTTFSAMAYVNKYGQAEIIPNREGDRTTPSVICFEGETPIVGSAAKNAAVTNPIVQFVKRRMGDPKYSFLTDSEKVYKAEELSAIILKRLKEDAETMLGEPITDAVITVPAYFDDAKRKATQDAGKIAGLNVIRIINEPTAAAFAFGMQTTDREQTVLIYDLGGGTFDVTIIKIVDSNYEVIATHGDPQLGGFDWDNALMKYLNEEFKSQGGTDLYSELISEQDLRQKSERAKIALSGLKTTKVFLSAAGKTASITLTLEKFQEITSPLIQKTADIMEIVLEDAGLTWQDIDTTLLVGGSTKMKAVSSLIEKITGKPGSKQVNPDEAVAIGAALQGALLQINEGKFGLSERGEQKGKSDIVEREMRGSSTALVELSKIKIQDVTSHSLGMIAQDSNYKKNANFIIIKKNTPIPCQESSTFCTLEEMQSQMSIQVTQGEDKDIRYIRKIGESLVNLVPHPKGSPVEVFYSYDENGMIHVTVYDLVPNPKKYLGEFKIDRVANMDEKEVNEKQKKFANFQID